MLVTSSELDVSITVDTPANMRSSDHARLMLRIAQQHITRAVVSIRKVNRIDITDSLNILHNLSGAANLIHEQLES